MPHLESSMASATVTETFAPPLPRFDPVDPRLFTDPYPVYRAYRALEPVHWGLSAPVAYPGAWYLFRHADTTTALKDPRFGKARRHSARAVPGQAGATIPPEALPYLLIGQQWVAHRDPPDHTRLHEALRPHFTAGAVARLRPRLTTIAEDLVDEAAGGATFDVVADYAARLPFLVICEVLGIPATDWPVFVEYSEPMRAIGPHTEPATWARASEAATRACAHLADLVAMRRRSPGDDVIGALTRARRAGLFGSDNELVANLLFLIHAAAGLHTTTGLIASGIHLLLSHPAQRAALAGRPGLIGAAVQEVLRYEPPLQLTNRVALFDVEVGGVTVNEGDAVIAVLASANRDPQAHPDPERFDIIRRHRPHQTFSAGTHSCFGAPLAIAEGEAAIGALLRRLPSLAPAGPVGWATTGSLRVPSALPVSH
jgi:cytochrome P450